MENHGIEIPARSVKPPADPDSYRAQTMPWTMKSTKKTTMKERSNIPTGGMMLRNGRSTGSVRSARSETTVVSGLPGRTGNHDRTARAASTTK